MEGYALKPGVDGKRIRRLLDGQEQESEPDGATGVLRFFIVLPVEFPA
jgi:hypothetical protein